MFVVSENCIRVNVGGTVTVHGGVFTPSCKAKIGNKNYNPIEVSAGEFSFVAPSEPQETTFQIVNGSVTSPTVRLVVVPAQELQVFELSRRTSGDFDSLVRGLLPRGFNFSGPGFGKLFAALSLSLLYVYNFLISLVKESNPYTTTDLDAWEVEMGLPRNGLAFEDPEIRRREILKIARARGGLSLPYYRLILDMYGKDYEIYEYWKNPEKFPAWVASVHGERARFFVLFKIYNKEFSTGATCTSGCTASLGGERDSDLEALLNEIKPAHVQFIFSYFIRILTDDDGVALTDGNGKYLTV